MSNILITGGLGFIGFSLANKLNISRNKVVIVDKKKQKKFQKKKYLKIYKFDCNSIFKLRKIVIEEKIDTVIHCAADIDISQGEKNKKNYMKNNYGLVKKIVNLINSTDCKNLIFSSTAAVYGNSTKKLSEKSKKNPQNIYGLSKLKAERYIKENLKYGKNYIIFRYFNVVGNYKKISGVLNKNINPLFKVISKKIILGKKLIPIFGNNFKTKDGTAIRDYVHIEDLCDFHSQIIKKNEFLNKNLELNLGYGKGYSNHEIIKGFQKYVQKKIRVKIKKKRKGEIEKAVCNNNKLKRIINYKPKKNSLKKMILDSFWWYNFNG